MQVLKFGGTSVGSANAIKSSIKIISAVETQAIVVFSAISGVTNLFGEINTALLLKDIPQVARIAGEIRRLHVDIINSLFEKNVSKQSAIDIVDQYLKTIELKMTNNKTPNPKEILALGELISSNIIFSYFNALGLDARLINAQDYMRIDENEEPDHEEIKGLLQELISDISNKYIITQGYICKNKQGQVDNFKQGGSDYSATILGMATDAEMIQIWTDIDGLHNNDPQFVNNTKPITSLSFEETAELAYFGAKILHPQSLLPAKKANIPVLLKNTFEPTKPGTIIQKQVFKDGVRAIAAKDGITSIKIKSYRMLMSYGFLKKVFEIFERHKTPIDVITTSEVAVSLTIDSRLNLQNIVDQLSSFGEVTVEDQLSVVCVVGYFPSKQVGMGMQVFSALKKIPIRMISFGGSQHNISLIIKSKYKVAALNDLHSCFFREINSVSI